MGLRSKLLRKVAELKSESVCSGTPDEFLCPITRELMREPVIAAGKLSPLLLNTHTLHKRAACLRHLLLPNRWLLVRKRGHRELDQHQEPHQPHDQPPLTDDAAHPEPHPEDGHQPLEDQPLAPDRPVTTRAPDASP